MRDTRVVLEGYREGLAKGNGGLNFLFSETTLHDVAPNPFNPETVISFSLRDRADVEIGVFDLSGKKVAVLVDEQMGTGLHSVRWNGRDAAGRMCASGVYLVQMRAGSSVFTRRAMLVK